MDIYIGDCISGMNKVVQPNSIDLAIADPPFGIDFDKVAKGGSYERNSDLVMSGYVEVPTEQYDSFTRSWISALYLCLKRTGSAYVFSGWSNLLTMLSNIAKAGFTVVNHIIWRYQFSVFTKRKFTTSHYHVLLIVKDPDQYAFYKKYENEYIEDVWVFRRPYTKDEERYPTKLPPMLVEKCIEHSTKPGDLVLDPFLGSGTTAIVANKTKRNFVGFEKNDNCERLYNETFGGPICRKI